MEFYSKIKEEFKFETYLELPDFELRKTIAKLRCSDHALEIEKGRHRNETDRNTRLCKVCDKGEIETEEHFLNSCELYENLKITHEIPVRTSSIAIMRDMDPIKLGKFLSNAWTERKNALEQPQNL